MAKPTRNRRPTKPGKPHPDFPLWPHPSGRWTKKVKGRQFYFGKVSDDPKGERALELWLGQKDDLLAGREPVRRGEATLADVVNEFLSDADRRREEGDLSVASFLDYRHVGGLVVEHFGRNADPCRLRPVDVAEFRHSLAKRYAPTRLAKTVTVARMILRWAYETELIDTLPRFGPGFRPMSKRAAREAKQRRNGRATFRAAEIRAMLGVADATLKAMLLLAINGGLGNTDLATLPLDAVDLDAGWVDFPRPKTGVERRVPLWPETVDALRDAIASRPCPKDDSLAGRVFLTSTGGPWIVETAETRSDKLPVRFATLMDAAGCRVAGRGLYALRHTFQSVGDEAGDALATSHIMGHVDSSIGGHYRESISDGRLRLVTEHVRGWLFGGGSEGDA